MTEHRLELAHQVLLAAFMLFVIVIALFTLDMDLAGKATTSTTAYIVNSTAMNCTFDVAAGYNIISLPCLSTAEPIATVTNNTQVLAIYQYVPGDADPWRVYNPNLPNYVVSDLRFMTRRAGYVAIMGAPANLTIEGLRVARTDVPIVPGWSLVGYPSFTTRNASDAFSSISGSMNRAATYDRAAASFIYYPDGSLVYVVPGQGYWINGTASASWAVTP
jgi:hypothetical protein